MVDVVYSDKVDGRMVNIAFDLTRTWPFRQQKSTVLN